MNDDINYMFVEGTFLFYVTLFSSYLLNNYKSILTFLYILYILLLLFLSLSLFSLFLSFTLSLVLHRTALHSFCDRERKTSCRLWKCQEFPGLQFYTARTWKIDFPRPSLLFISYPTTATILKNYSYVPAWWCYLEFVCYLTCTSVLKVFSCIKSSLSLSLWGVWGGEEWNIEVEIVKYQDRYKYSCSVLLLNSFADIILR